MKKYLALQLLFSFLFLAGCTSYNMVQTDLYFGMSGPDGTMVSEQEWQDFMSRNASKVFLYGFTVLDAAGKYKDTATGKLISEPAKVITACYKPNRKITLQIDSLCNTYKEIFKQQSVLRIDRKVNAVFH
jgi:hypothetical protein